jgi:hypothetical protein
MTERDVLTRLFVRLGVVWLVVLACDFIAKWW